MNYECGDLKFTWTGGKEISAWYRGKLIDPAPYRLTKDEHAEWMTMQPSELARVLKHKCQLLADDILESLPPEHRETEQYPPSWENEP